jgi:hypothetical protein
VIYIRIFKLIFSRAICHVTCSRDINSHCQLINALSTTTTTPTPTSTATVPTASTTRVQDGAGGLRRATREHKGLETRLEPPGTSFFKKFLFYYLYLFACRLVATSPRTTTPTPTSTNPGHVNAATPATSTHNGHINPNRVTPYRFFTTVPHLYDNERASRAPATSPPYHHTTEQVTGGLQGLR